MWAVEESSWKIVDDNNTDQIVFTARLVFIQGAISAPAMTFYVTPNHRFLVMRTHSNFPSQHSLPEKVKEKKILRKVVRLIPSIALFFWALR